METIVITYSAATRMYTATVKGDDFLIGAGRSRKEALERLEAVLKYVSK